MTDPSLDAMTKRAAIPSKTEIVASSIAAGLGIGVLSLIVERLVEPLNRFTVASIADQAVATVITALCVFILRRNARKRRLLDLQRFELIAESTQQIRQALQLITDSAVPGTPQQHVVIYAIDHIEWVLQEVLPTVHQEPKEVQERLKTTNEPKIFEP